MPLDDSHLAHALLALFRAHEVEAVVDGKWIVFPHRDLRITASLARQMELPTAITVQLDVRFEMGKSRTIVESFAGVGPTQEQAVAQAFHVFATNVFHVLLSAFFQIGDDQITHEQWTVGSSSRLVTISNISGRGPLPSSLPLDECLRMIQDELVFLNPGPELHWIRYFIARGKGDQRTIEVMLDNSPWKEAQAEIAGLDWPESESFYSIRCFLIVAEEAGWLSALGELDSD